MHTDHLHSQHALKGITWTNGVNGSDDGINFFNLQGLQIRNGTDRLPQEFEG